jgi:predicted house-cleaning noncanonical NTP pyrophosphatase (MazG superfamily)
VEVAISRKNAVENKMRYNKLVRDKIPEYIKSKGDTPIIHIADDEEYWEKLKEKLQEEIKEFVENEAIEEMADIQEVLDAMCNYKKFDKEELLSAKEKKAKERGSFKKKIILEES